jgi:alpha-mannosidase
MIRSRTFLIIAALSLLAIGYWRTSRAGAAPPQNDPNVIWSIGQTDNSSDEFTLGSAESLSYTIGKDSASAWRQQQESASANAPVYRIDFGLDQVPAEAPTLALNCIYLGTSPAWLELTVNHKRGRFRVRPESAPDLDERQSNQITHSRQSFRIPLAPSWLASNNEIGISFSGAGGSVWYDSLALLRSGGAPAPSALVEPTIFFRREGGQLKEITDVVLRHDVRLGDASLELKVGPSVASGRSPDDAFDFGERLIELALPAVSAPAPYSLRVASGGKTSDNTGEFRPEKRWRIFAGLKIHNDIGYTDLQPHVQELDNRNTDNIIDLIGRSPFYKFNFETSWLVENFIASRRPERVKQFMALAAKDRVGVNAFYLNIMTGMCTGEELYRALYYSKALARQYGMPFRFACLTDAPSHTWAVPSILASAGVVGFANGSNQARAPLLQHSGLNEDSPFWWEGPDGSKVLTWFARGYSQFDRLTGAPRCYGSSQGGNRRGCTDPTANANPVERMRRNVSQFLARYRRPDYPVDAVLIYGLYGDNVDIRRGEAQMLQEWHDAYAFPSVVAATDADYYAYIAERFANKIPTFKGDAGAYWEDGSGSTAAETAINRDTQRLLPAAEAAGALATAFHSGEVYPAQEFRDAWKNTLFYDEHTWGASRSISQPDRKLVTDQWEFKRAYAMRAHWAAKDLMYRSFNRLVQNISVDGPTLFVFNPDVWPRTGVVELEIDPGRDLVDMATGAAVPVEETGRKDNCRTLRFVARDVAGMGYKAYGVRTGTPVPAPAIPASGWQIESRWYRVVFDPTTGGIAELYDKELGRELVDRRAPYKLNELLYVSGGENSRIVREELDLRPAALEITGQSDARVVANTGRRIVIQARAKNVPSIEIEVSLYDDIKRVDFVDRLQKTATRGKEAVYFAFPFAVSPPQLAYQVQNAWVRPDADQLPGACREWFTTQNLVVARDAGAAIAWATPDSPLITLTDINRGKWLRRLDVANGYVFSYPMNNYWFTNYKAAQGGDYTFRYFLTSARSLPDADLARFDAETRSPLVAYPYYDMGNVREYTEKKRMPAAGGSFFEIRAPNAQVTAFKPAEDGNGYILRLRETAGTPGIAKVLSPVFPLAGANLCDGVEDHCSVLPLQGSALEVPLKPHAFSTVRLLFR